MIVMVFVMGASLMEYDGILMEHHEINLLIDDVA